MAREIEADGVEFVLQPLGGVPIRRRRPSAGVGRPRRRAVAEEVHLLARAVARGGGGVAQQQVDGGEGLRAVAVERVEGPGLDQAFELAAVEAARIEAAGEIEEIGEGAVRLALRDELAHRLRADALDRGQRIADRRRPAG